MSIIQPGDIISVGKVAWDIYEYGWTSELAASVQYELFGREFKHLAENLGILAKVVETAQESLSRHGVTSSSEVRWDSESLIEIIGDFHGTLRECRQLLEDNKKYCGPPSGPLDNLRWHVVVQPSADRLKHRLQLQNARIQTVLKPFEIDLLTQIHKDLSRQIHHVHTDLKSLMGVLVPNLKAELDQKDKLRIDLLPIPPDIEPELEEVFLDHPGFREHGRQYPPLKDMAGAFVVSLERSTKEFTPGQTIVQSTPSVKQYLNLLMCLYLLKKMERSRELQDAPEHSHWPSYVQELKKALSYECDRFRHKMHEPRFTLAELDKKALVFWIEEKSDDIDVIHLQVMMEDLVNVPLFTNPSEESKHLRLLRHTNTNDQRYRLVISTEKRQVARHPPRPVIEDFNVTTAVLEPLYAVPFCDLHPPYNMALHANDKIFPLAFVTLEDAFLFQQGITGFKVTDNYFQPNTMVCFVTRERGVEKFEKASAQIWIHSRLAGSLVIPDNSDSASPDDGPPSPTLSRARTAPANLPDQPRSPAAQSSPDMAGRDRARMPSFSSVTTTATDQSNISSSDAMVTVHGSNGRTTAPVLKQPYKPLLVLLTRDPETQRCAIDVVSIAGDTRRSQQGKNQKVCIVEQPGFRNYVAARRLWSLTGQWNLLCLRADCRKGCVTEAWDRLSRVSFLFLDVEARIGFGGIFCACKRRTVGQEKECMDRGHLGQLGKAAVFYRQKMDSYYKQLYKIVPQVSYHPKD